MSFAVRYESEVGHPRERTLAAAKARAIRAVAVRHHDEVVAEMQRLGWRYVAEGITEPAAKTGRPCRWVRDS